MHPLGCNITVGHQTFLTNLAQCPIEKRFLLLNGWTMSSENLFVVESEVTKILCLHFLIESNSTTSVNLKTELFNNCLFSFLLQIIMIWKNICHYIFPSLL